MSDDGSRPATGADAARDATRHPLLRQERHWPRPRAAVASSQGDVVACVTGGLDRQAFGSARARDRPAGAQPRGVGQRRHARQRCGQPPGAVVARPARDRRARSGNSPPEAGARSKPQVRTDRLAGAEAVRPRDRRQRAPPATGAAIEQLLTHRGTGLGARAIAEHANANDAAKLALLRELEASGQVRREGSRRTTASRLITDEDPIAQRAAEREPPGATSGTRQARPPGRDPVSQ